MQYKKYYLVAKVNKKAPSHTVKCCMNSPVHRAVPMLTDTVVDLAFRDVFCQAKVSNLYQIVTVN